MARRYEHFTAQRANITPDVLANKFYDARLVAAMSVHNLTHLLTFNTDDFKRFTIITAVNSQTLLNQ